MTNAFLAKALIAALLVPSSVGPVANRLRARLREFSPLLSVSLFAAMRFGLAIVVFVLIGMRLPNDALNYYSWFGGAALDGLRDARSPYSPGFDYALAGLLWAFGSPLSFVFFVTAAEVAAFAITIHVVRREDPALATNIAFLWLVSPISLFHVVLGGRNDALVLLTWSAVLWATNRGRPVAGGVVGAVGLACSKILAVFALLPLAVESLARAIRGGTAFLISAALFTAGFVALQTDVTGVLNEGRMVTSGNVWSLPYILWQSGPRAAEPWQFVVCASALVAAIVLLRQRPVLSRCRQSLRLTGTVGCVFLMFSPKSFTGYAVIFLPGVLFLIDSLRARTETWIAAAFLVACSFEPSLWFYFSQGTSLEGSRWGRPAMLIADAALLLGYSMLVRRGILASQDERERCVERERASRVEADPVLA